MCGDSCRRLHKYPGKYPEGSDERSWLQYRVPHGELPDEQCARGSLPRFAFNQALCGFFASGSCNVTGMTGMTEAAADALRTATEKFIELSATGEGVPEPSIKTLHDAQQQIGRDAA